MMKNDGIVEVKGRVEEALRRSTFHGLDVVLEAPQGYRRTAAIVFVAIMTVFAISGTIYSIIDFLNFPYKTLVNYEQRPFSFPEVTVCPFSPFTEDMLSKAPKDVRLKYERLFKFWKDNNQLDKSTKMKYLKRSFVSLYYQYNKYLRRDWNSLFISCHYNGENCLQNIVDIEHPMAYQCFQISLNLSAKSGSRSGYTRGLQLILFRNYMSSPKLMLNEFYDQIYMEFINGDDNIIKFDGVLIIVHGQNELPSFKLTASPNNYPIIFGNRISITLKGKYYKQTKTIRRRCSDNPVYYKLLKLTDFFISRTIETQKKFLFLNLGNCASMFRQQLISSKCNCFTENEMIPSEKSAEFKKKGFCHDVSWFRNKSRSTIMENIYCSKNIELLPDKEILKKFLRPKSSVTDRTKTLCMVPCDRTILRLKRIQADEIMFSMNLDLFPEYFQTIEEQNLLSSFDIDKINQTSIPAKNLIVIDIHAEEERIPILDEDLDKNYSNFVAEIGGVFGLFLGISGVTLFEILECFILLFTIVLIKFRNKSKKSKKKIRK